MEELPQELVLALPYVGALDGSFAGLFRELDKQLGALSLAGYGISDTSLEEVQVVGRVTREGYLAGAGAPCVREGRSPRPCPEPLEAGWAPTLNPCFLPRSS